jgi:hypothetical protein
MRDTWIKIGCFLTGYNYNLVKSSSELTKKRVIKYTSALLIICMLWAFVGYAFTGRYLKGAWYECLLASVICVFLIIQIERQVILASEKNRVLFIFRSAIAIAMAMIGTVIIDQIIFVDDIDKRKISVLDQEVEKYLPSRERELRRQVFKIDSAIVDKESERRTILEDINKHPYIKTYKREVLRDSLGHETVSIHETPVPNPKFPLLQPMDKAIADLREEKSKKEAVLVALREVLVAELKSKVGLLDELEVMFGLLSESLVSFAAWFIWFVFLLGLELFIVVSKMGEEETDYDRMIKQQVMLYYRRIELLESSSKSG